MEEITVDRSGNDGYTPVATEGNIIFYLTHAVHCGDEMRRFN